MRDSLVPTIFHEPWWLEAATGGQYEEATVSLGGRTVGRLPFVRTKRLRFVSGTMPDLTPFLGPAIDEGSGGVVSRNLRRQSVTGELIQKLQHLDEVHQVLHRGVPDALPFLQHGFDVQASFIYELMPAPEAEIWRNMRDKARNVIRRAQEQVELTTVEPEEFCRLYESNLAERGEHRNYMFGPSSLAVFEAALSRGRGCLLGARSSRGELSGAIFYAWDDAVSYYLLTTRMPQAHNGIVNLLVWEAVRASAAQGRIFCFGGVGRVGNIALFFTSFGGEIRPCYVVHRISPAYRALRLSAAQARSAIQTLKESAGRWKAPFKSPVSAD